MNESHEAGAGRGTVTVGPDWAQDVWCDYRNYGHFIAQCERRWQAGFRPHLGGKDKDELLRLIRVYQGRTYGKAAPRRTRQADASGFANNVRAAMAAYQEGDVSQGESHHTTATGVTGMSATTGTLNDMTVEQLRDLAKRAEATLKEKEAAAQAKVLKFGAVGEIVQDDTLAGVKTSTHWFAVDKRDGVLTYATTWIPAAVVADANSMFRQRWFSNDSRDTINTAENRAAVLQLLATVGAWK